jgi:hypothetical protein
MDGADAVQYILDNKIEGAIVECGIGAGNFEMIWIQQLMKNKSVRDIYMFDTFGGLTEPSKYDYTAPTASIYSMSKDQVHSTWKSQIINESTNNWCYVPLEKVKATLNSTGYPQENLHYIVGDVMKTLQDESNIPEKIAILRLDTDWYESSKIELEKMYDKVVDKGVIIFDDYYHWDGQRRATDDFFESIGIKYNFVNIGNQKTAAIIKTKTDSS